MPCVCVCVDKGIVNLSFLRVKSGRLLIEVNISLSVVFGHSCMEHKIFYTKCQPPHSETPR